MKLMICPILLCSWLASAALAGDVTVVVKDGDLVITGSEDADGFSLSTAGNPPHEVDVQPDFGLGTTVNGVAAPFHATGVKKDVRIQSKGGGDHVSIGAQLPRDVRVDLGDADDEFSIAGSVGRDLRVDFGAGLARLMTNVLTVGRDASIAVGEAWDGVKLQNTTIGDDLKLKFASAVDGTRMTTLDSVEVGDGLSISGGADRGATELIGCVVHGKATVKLGGGTSTLACATTTVERDARFSSSGAAVIGIDTGSFGRDVRISVSGDSADLHVKTGSSIAGDLAILSRAMHAIWNGQDLTVDGDFTLRATGFGVFEGTTAYTHVHGAFAAETGRSADKIQLVYFFVDRQARVDLGDGADDFYAAATTTGRPLAVLLGGGDDKFALGSPATVAGLTVNAGSGSDTITMGFGTISRSARIQLGSGNNVAQLKNMAFDADLSVTAGGGDDQLDLSASTVAGKKLVKLGGGMNSTVP